MNIYGLELDSLTPGPKDVPTAEATISSTRVDWDPKFSPDGRKIAFISERTGHDELWVCDPDGKNASQLTRGAGPVLTSPELGHPTAVSSPSICEPLPAWTSTSSA